MAANRRMLVLGGTLIVAVVGFIVMRPGSDTPKAAAPARPRPAVQGKTTTSAENAPPADVRLETLGRDRGEPIDAGRNPFRFKPKPAPPPPPPPPQPQRPPGPSDPGGSGFSPGTPVTPPPPPITLKFIGMVEKSDGTRIAVLSDGKRPISGKEGEEIEGRYKILKIGNESLEIAYIDGRGRTQLRLSGQ